MDAPLTLDELRNAAQADRIDTLLLALTDMQGGRLQGERPAFEGNAYVSDKPRVPGTLREAHDRFAASPVAREAFGEEVVAHYLNHTRVELEAFEAAVTDWERVRGFERL